MQHHGSCVFSSRSGLNKFSEDDCPQNRTALDRCDWAFTVKMCEKISTRLMTAYLAQDHILKYSALLC